MGMPKQVVKMLLEENKYSSISDEFISFGKQTVPVTKKEIVSLLNNYGYDSSIADSYYSSGKLDNKTRHGGNTLEDVDFLKMFADINYNVMDISDYEGANILHDLNTPVPTDLHNKFDFVFTGGCLDNVFNPVSLLVNSSKLLKNGGRVAHYETFHGLIGAYLMFSPEWFYSYYAVNGFDDVKVYVCHHREESNSRFDYSTDLYLWQPYFTHIKDFNYYQASINTSGIFYCMVIAQKGSKSTSDKMPVQLQYLDSNTEDWRKSYETYKNSDRKLMAGEYKKEYSLPFNSDHFIYLGSGY